MKNIEHEPRDTIRNINILTKTPKKTESGQSKLFHLKLVLA